MDSGGVINCCSRASKLTRGKLQRQGDWGDWQNSEWLQLNQYMSQFLFGDPAFVKTQESVFNLAWTYNIKTENGRKKARCTCDCSTRAG